MTKNNRSLCIDKAEKNVRGGVLGGVKEWVMTGRDTRMTGTN